MNEMDIYNKIKTPPSEALKTIESGRLKGYSDINPQWRIEKMTEVFGVCGDGWKYEVIDKQVIDCVDNQKFVSIDVNLYVKLNDKWSEPIFATGGDVLVKKEKQGMYLNDEAFKMALTDALGNAMKNLGMAADVYRGFTKTKYTDNNKPQSNNNKPASSRELTNLEVEQKWNGKIYGKCVYIDNIKIQVSEGQLEKLKSHKKYTPNDKK